MNDKERGGPVRFEGVSGRIVLGVLSGDPVGEIGVGDSTRLMHWSTEDSKSPFPVSSSCSRCPLADDVAELSFASWLALITALTEFTDGGIAKSQCADHCERVLQSLQKRRLHCLLNCV